MVSWLLYLKKGDNMLNVALTFLDEDNKKIGLVSNVLHKFTPSVYIPCVNSVPHISLTHIEGEIEDAEKMWDILLARGIKYEYDVVLKAFCVSSPYKERVYTSFMMEEFGKLSKLQGEIIAAFPDRQVYNEVGADFTPHITTSCHLNLMKAKKIPARYAPFKRVKAYLTIGTRDTYGRMEKILFKHEFKG